MEEDVTWVALKVSGVAVSLGSDALDLKNWILCLECAYEELQTFIADLED